MKLSRFPLFCLAATSFLLANAVQVHSPVSEISTTVSLSLDSPAQARSSGGRARSGSFRSSPSRSRSSDSNSSNSNRSSPSRQQPAYNSGPVYVPVPTGPTIYRDRYPNDPYRNGTYSSTSSTGGGGWIVGLILLGGTLSLVVLLVYLIIRASRSGRSSGYNSKTERELFNDTVTVSKIQVALLAQARYMQEQLTSLTEDLHLETPSGMQQLAQETALALLRSPENWSHVLASSQTVKSREAAENLFEQLSITERSKFSAETLVKVGGKLRRQGFSPDAGEGPASYIVVTLLVGTAHDQPLFSQIRTETDLKQALESLAALPADYLMVFEALWTPQDPSDSLTYEEMLMEYTEMVQI